MISVLVEIVNAIIEGIRQDPVWMLGMAVILVIGVWMAAAAMNGGER